MRTSEHIKRPIAKDITLVLLTAAAILLVPAAAMQFTTEMNWGPGDFVLAFALIAGTGLAYVCAARMLHTFAQRAAAAVGLAVVFLLLWLEIAVGLFGTPISGS